MIIYTEQSIFESPADILGCPVNCMGTMGAGLAKEFKKRFKGLEIKYKTACQEGKMQIGKCRYFGINDKLICLFPTKNHWRDKTKLRYIYNGLAHFTDLQLPLLYFKDKFNKTDIKISFPQLGCGLGGLDWESQVKPIMEHYLKGE